MKHADPIHRLVKTEQLEINAFIFVPRTFAYVLLFNGASVTMLQKTQQLENLQSSELTVSFVVKRFV